MKNHNKFWIIFSLIIVFVIGVTSGFIFENKFSHKSVEKRQIERRPVHFPTMKTMSEELSLTATQQKKIKEIFEKNDESLRILRNQIHKRLFSIRSQLIKEIKVVLNGEQIKKFDAMIEEYSSKKREEELKQRKRHPKKEKGGRK